ncbi:hypothetical protein BC829DRAFT_446566 [Chytridium lagenaria]|nr:hypothetical protein BC829DRAFT_446566 [Chytridium lagenaria]
MAPKEAPAAVVASTGKKAKKNVGETINQRLALVMKSGKYTLGYKSTLKTIRQGKAKLIIISGNTPPLRKSELEYYAMLSKTGVHHYGGNNIDLGTACGKYYRVGVLSIVDAATTTTTTQQHLQDPDSIFAYSYFTDRRHERHSTPTNTNTTTTTTTTTSTPQDPQRLAHARTTQNSVTLEAIGRNLQQQYEIWQPRARYRLSLDPSVEETKKLCCSLRRNAKEERVLFHYNGHGVPKPTSGGEVWVFNKNYTQYIPVSVYDIQSWLGAPSQTPATFSKPLTNLPNNVNAASNPSTLQPQSNDPSSSGGEETTPRSTTSMKDCIQLAACGPTKTPHHQRDPDMIMKIPGRLTIAAHRWESSIGSLTAITDTIAWNTGPHGCCTLSQLLLAERIMRYYSCTPMSHPALPSTHQHPMWSAWDLAAELCISQLPSLIRASDANLPLDYKHSNFFSEQLTAFEIWLSRGAVQKAGRHGPGRKNHPEQLPIVLQVLLSQVHRLRALMLVEPSPAAELKPVLVFIWAKILAVDPSCQNDLLKDNGYTYFVNILSAGAGALLTPPLPSIPNLSEHRAMCCFILAVFCNGFRGAQEALLKNDLLGRLYRILRILIHWVHEKILFMLGDPVAEVRASAVCALRGLVHVSGMESLVCVCVMYGLVDGSVGVRKEVVGLLSRVVEKEEQGFVAAAYEFVKDERARGGTGSGYEGVKEERVRGGNGVPSVSARDWERPSRNSTPHHHHHLWRDSPTRTQKMIHIQLLKALLVLSVDPFYHVANMAASVVDAILYRVMVTFGAHALFQGDGGVGAFAETVTPPPPTHDECEGVEEKHVVCVHVEIDHGGIAGIMSEITPDAEVKERVAVSVAAAAAVPAVMTPISLTVDEQVATLKSGFFDWSLEYFTEPQMKVPEVDDPGSRRFNERLWRKERNERIVAGGEAKRFVEQVCVLHSDNNPGGILTFHGFEGHLAGADCGDGVIVYNWKEQTRLSWFSNSNPPGTKVTFLKFINEDDAALLVTGSSDGAIRVYRKYDNVHTVEVVSAWKAVKPAVKQPMFLLADWQQGSGSLVVSGETGMTRIWDVEREVCAQELRSKVAVPMTSLFADKTTGDLIVSGYADGQINIFDKRLASDNVVMQLYDHKQSILGAQTRYYGGSLALVSGDVGGRVQMMDLRGKKTVWTQSCVPNGAEMTAFAVHENASLFSCGTNSEYVWVYNMDGKNLSTIRYNDGFLGPRIGHVGCMTFHPHYQVLAVGTTANASLSVFASDVYTSVL